MKLKRIHKLLIILIISLLLVVKAIPKYIIYYLKSNDEELIDRKINLESLSINYLTGSLTIGELLIYEDNNKDTFIFVSSIHINPNIISCIGREYVIRNVEIDGLACNTILTDSIFNFNSIINHFQDSTTVEKDTTPLHYTIEKISLTNSYLCYTDININSFVAINKFNTFLPKGITWNNSNLNILSDFDFTTGGHINATFNFNIESGGYDLKLNSNKLNLSILSPYLKDFMLINSLEGNLNTDLFLQSENSSESANIDISGDIGIKQITLIDSSDSKVIGVENVHISIDSINAAKDIYELNALKVNLPYVRYEMYHETDNFTQLFKRSESSTAAKEAKVESNIFVLIKDYVVETLLGIKVNNFSIDTVAITNGEALYIDHTMLEKFEYTVSKTNLIAYNVKSDTDSLLVDLSALLNNKGKLVTHGILHPKKPEDVTLNVTIDKLMMKDLSPYFNQYFAYPVTKGSLDMICDLEVMDKQLVSESDLFLQSFMLGEIQKHKDDMNLPIKLGLAMLKDKDGNIQLNVPVKGNLADPKYKVWEMVDNIFKDLILKAARSPYNMIAGAIDKDEASAKIITLDNLISDINKTHHQKLDKIAKVLVEKPSLVLFINPHYNLKTETEKMAVVFAKAEYLKFGIKKNYSSNELKQIETINIKDPMFENYINKRINLATELSTKEKMVKLYEPTILKQYIESYIASKLTYMYRYLMSKGVKPAQLQKHTASFYQGFDKSSSKKVQYQLLFDVAKNEQ